MRYFFWCASSLCHFLGIFTYIFRSAADALVCACFFGNWSCIVSGFILRVSYPLLMFPFESCAVVVVVFPG